MSVAGLGFGFGGRWCAVTITVRVLGGGRFLFFAFAVFFRVGGMTTQHDDDFFCDGVATDRFPRGGLGAGE